MAIDISATTRRIVYTGSSGVGPYSFAFEVLAETDIAVYFNDTELTLTTDYTVTVNPDGTGSATLIVGSDVPSTPTASDRITIVGDRTIQRTTDFTTGGPLFATSLNDEFDSQTIFVQQVQEQSDRSMRAPNTDPTTVNMVLPRNTVRANKTLAFDANGDPVIGEQIGDNRGNWQPSTPYNKRDLVKDTSNNNVYLCNTAHTSSGSLPIATNTDADKWDLLVDAESASSYAASAAASAAAAATSETNAAASATSAATSAATATTKASEATTSASNAATSETNAASSASTASTAATTATTKASEASTSASNAATSETNAASSAGSAATSASTATTAAINASASASSAATSSSSASTSAANAATSETNAATSASSAAASATAAQTAAESIDAFYLGAQASDPTVDLNGDPVTAGDWYFNTSSNETRIYNGSSWQVTAISSSGFLTAGDIGSTVQGYDANTAKLDVAQTFTATQTFSTVSLGNWTITESSGVLDFATGGTNRMKIDASGNLTVSGEIRATNNVTAFYSSDKNLKENIADIESAIEKVCSIGGKTFDWKESYIEAKGGEDGYFVQKHDIGVIAQDVQEVLPEAVREREDGTLAVDYPKLVSVAFQAIKELKEELDKLKGE